MELNAIWARLAFLLSLTTAILAYNYETRSFQVPVSNNHVYPPKLSENKSKREINILKIHPNH